MIRAHLATFPPRSEILMRTVESILPQVDLLCVCLNGYDRVPAELADHDKIRASIPEMDLKDAGKFAFPVAPDDIVFTIDDDILYPPDYVAETVRVFDRLDPSANVLGHLGNAWVVKRATGRHGWRTYRFNRQVPQITKVDVVGTGTACQIGRLLPPLDAMVTSAGFVDLRHARLHHNAGHSLWVVPHADDAIRSTMSDALRESSLFNTHTRSRHPDMLAELGLLMRTFTPFSGMKLETVLRERDKSRATGKSDFGLEVSPEILSGIPG